MIAYGISSISPPPKPIQYSLFNILNAVYRNQYRYYYINIQFLFIYVHRHLGSLCECVCVRIYMWLFTSKPIALMIYRRIRSAICSHTMQQDCHFGILCYFAESVINRMQIIFTHKITVAINSLAFSFISSSFSSFFWDLSFFRSHSIFSHSEFSIISSRLQI